MDHGQHDERVSRAVAIPFVLAFLAMISAGPLFLAFGEPVQTRAATPFPTWSTDAFLEGRLAEELRLHLRETSRVTVTFRGVASEALYVLGLYEPLVVVGRGNALFERGSVSPSFRRIEIERPERQTFYRELLAWTDARGIRLLCVVVPDKVRVIPERLYPDGVLPEPKRSAYRAILAELRECGIETVDLESEMAQARAERPDLDLYGDHDTHWTVHGAWRSTRRVVDHMLALGWLDDIPPAPIVGMPGVEFEARQDLGSIFGFLEHGLFERRLIDMRRTGGVRLAVPGGPSAPLLREQPDAGIALCGDSFAAGMLGWTLPAATGRLVDSIGAVPGKGPLFGLVDTLERISRQELRPRVIVWEFIERSQAEDFWVPSPKLP